MRKPCFIELRGDRYTPIIIKCSACSARFTMQRGVALFCPACGVRPTYCVAHRDTERMRLRYLVIEREMMEPPPWRWRIEERVRIDDCTGEWHPWKPLSFRAEHIPADAALKELREREAALETLFTRQFRIVHIPTGHVVVTRPIIPPRNED
jgi:hypothetical protein